jgi:endonuclease III
VAVTKRADRPRRPDPGEPPSPGTVREIHRRLGEHFGSLDPPRGWDPLEELVLTVLSQNTSDVNSGRAYQALRARYPTWDEVAAADPAELAEAIRPGGLANTKAPRIVAILEEIRRRQGGDLDLGWMRETSSGEVRDYLTSLPGVGPKTAACVLAFALGRPALPVDTHVLRVARRLGFLGERTDAAAAHRIMEELVPEELRVEMHVGMIRLGRTVCRAGRPSCHLCPLLDLCPTGAAVMEGRAWAQPEAADRPARTAAARSGKRPAVASRAARTRTKGESG